MVLWSIFGWLLFLMAPVTPVGLKRTSHGNLSYSPLPLLLSSGCEVILLSNKTVFVFLMQLSGHCNVCYC